MLGLNLCTVFVLILPQLTLVSALVCKGSDCRVIEEFHYVNDERTLLYDPDLSYKMLLLSAAAYDPVHTQQCLNNSLPSAKFQLQSVVTRSCDFLDNKCSGYVAVSHVEKAIVIAFRGSDGSKQILVEILKTLLVPEQHFLNGKVQSYWKRGFEGLWQCMESKVKSLVLANPSYQIWVTGHSLGAAMASLTSTWLAHYNIAPRKNIVLYTFGMPRVGDYYYALQHDQLVINSWRVVNFDDIVPRLPPLDIVNIKSGPYHHGMEVFYSVNAVSANSTHRECHGTPHDEDKTCSRNQTIVNLRQSIERHEKYFSVFVGQFCKTSVDYTGSSGEELKFLEDRCLTYKYKDGFTVEETTHGPSSSSTTASILLGSFYIICFTLNIYVCFL